MSQNPSESGHASYCVIGDDYFSVLGIPLIQGRLFGPDDGLNTPNVALISESLARRRWPNQDPIGRIVDFGNMDGNLKPLTIVGIVGDVRARGLDYPPSSIIYVDYRQRGMTPNSTPTVLIRTTASASTIIRSAREVLHQVAPGSPVQFSTFADDMNG